MGKFGPGLNTPFIPFSLGLSFSSSKIRQISLSCYFKGNNLYVSEKQTRDGL